MNHPHIVRSLALALALAAGSTAFAQVSINIVIAPPTPMYEVTPSLSPGYVWAPGYWAWSNDRYIWVRGRAIMHRTGYRWQPDNWEQRNGNYYRQAGRWERDVYVTPIKVQKLQKVKKPKHDNGKRHNGKNDDNRQ
jgi:hypothetical protein